jgi:tetratricopeptide (TPR) repeat protein
VAYGSQLGEHRARVHTTVARALERLDAGKLDECSALLAHHWEQAGEELEAARWHRRAAEWIGTRDPAEAVGHWHRVRELALPLAPGSGETWGLAFEACIRILTMGWRTLLPEDEAARAFADGRELLAERHDPGRLARLLDAYAAARSVAGHFREAAGYVEEALPLALASGDRGLQVALEQRLGFAYSGSGLDYAAALIATDRGLALAAGDAELGHEVVGWSPYVQLLMQRGDILIGLGRLGEAAGDLERATRLARERDEAEQIFLASQFSAHLELSRGNPRAALRRARAGAEAAEKLGAAFYRGVSKLFLTRCLNECEEYASALEIMDEMEKTGGLFSIASRTIRASALLGLGEVEAARAAAEEALGILSLAPDLCFQRVVTHLRLARVRLAAEGAAARVPVEAELERALTLIEETGFREQRPRVHEIRAELAAAEGDDATRDRELREAHRLYTEMGATGHAERLAQELGP